MKRLVIAIALIAAFAAPALAADPEERKRSAEFESYVALYKLSGLTLQEWAHRQCDENAWRAILDDPQGICQLKYKGWCGMPKAIVRSYTNEFDDDVGILAGKCLGAIDELLLEMPDKGSESFLRVVKAVTKAVKGVRYRLGHDIVLPLDAVRAELQAPLTDD